ncbi:MAG: sulfate transporter, partial [Cyanobacteria bacterium RYN_339]|nr:sulfate transporter [Cyanobacteria bacterium RYN_339]
MHITPNDRREGADASFRARLRFYLTPIDGRFEDLKQGNLAKNVARDFMAGLIVAMVAIPLAMGFAMASGLRPEQGIVGGAVAGLIGALFGGSKYQVYGPTAAFIPVIAGMMATHDQGFLVLASLLAGLVLLALGLGNAGKLVAKVPHAIVVGFTIGIACVIALSQLGEVLGLHAKLGYDVWDKLHGVIKHLDEVNPYAIVLALGTFAISKVLLRISPMIPAPLIGVGVGTLLASTLWAGKGLATIGEKFGQIPTNFLVFSGPAAIQWTPAFLGDLAF